MADPDLEEAEENIRILIAEELELHHRLDGHPSPFPDCPVCRAHGC